MPMPFFQPSPAPSSSIEPPFDLLAVSWPQPVRHSGPYWHSPPAWEAAVMPSQPVVTPRLQEGRIAWGIDWREFFRQGVHAWNRGMPGEMRGFHLVFRLRMRESGTLLFWDDDGSVIRREGMLVHEDRWAHGLTRHAIEVRAGELLEVAQWQFGWEWQWYARMEPESEDDGLPETAFLALLPAVEQRLHAPNGPALKMYTSGREPFRAAAAIYSMLLNGYRPESVYLFGEEQWSVESRRRFSRLLPFARIVPQVELMSAVRAAGGSALCEIARRHWFVSKAMVALIAEPAEACMLDDDLFVLDTVTDALDAYAACELVFSPDQHLEGGYRSTWERHLPAGHAPSHGALPTGRFNAGLFWLRNRPEPRVVVQVALRCRVDPANCVCWEQGLTAMLYAGRPVCELPSQRYCLPLFDGLPGGVTGYDYANNPCGYATIHFAGLMHKPDDAFAAAMIARIGARARSAAIVLEALA